MYFLKVENSWFCLHTSLLIANNVNIHSSQTMPVLKTKSGTHSEHPRNTMTWHFHLWRHNGLDSGLGQNRQKAADSKHTQSCSSARCPASMAWCSARKKHEGDGVSTSSFEMTAVMLFPVNPNSLLPLQ